MTPSTLCSSTDLGNVGGLGDFDEDSDVDDDDLGVFGADFGQIGWDAYQVTATATDEDGTYTSNTLPVVDPPPPDTVHAEVSKHETVASVSPIHAEVPVLQSGAGEDGGSKNEPLVFFPAVHTEVSMYERPTFLHDPAFGQAPGQWQARTSILEDYGWAQRWGERIESKPFGYKPWNSEPTGRLIDLHGDWEDGYLFGGKRVKKGKSDSRASWVEAFVSDVDKLNESESPNGEIRIVLPKGDEPEEM